MAKTNTPASELARKILSAPAIPAAPAPAKAKKPSLQTRLAIWSAEMQASGEQFEAVRGMVRDAAREKMALDAANAIIAYRAKHGLDAL